MNTPKSSKVTCKCCTKDYFLLNALIARGYIYICTKCGIEIGKGNLSAPVGYNQ